MNLEEIRTTVLRRLGVRSTDRFFDPEVVDAAINRGQERVDTEHDWTWLEATVTVNFTAGDANEILPDDWKSTKGVYHNGAHLLPVGLTEITHRGEYQTSETPRWFYVGNGTLTISPGPAAAFSVIHAYYKWSPPLEEDTDIPLIPKPWQQSLVWSAVAELAPDREDWDLAGKAEAQYQDSISKMRKSLRPVRGPFVVRQRAGGWI